jgi:hypothetical protein
MLLSVPAQTGRRDVAGGNNKVGHQQRLPASTRICAANDALIHFFCLDPPGSLVESTGIGVLDGEGGSGDSVIEIPGKDNQRLGTFAYARSMTFVHLRRGRCWTPEAAPGLPTRQQHPRLGATSATRTARSGKGAQRAPPPDRCMIADVLKRMLAVGSRNRGSSLFPHRTGFASRRKSR